MQRHCCGVHVSIVGGTALQQHAHAITVWLFVCMGVLAAAVVVACMLGSVTTGTSAHVPCTPCWLPRQLCMVLLAVVCTPLCVYAGPVYVSCPCVCFEAMPSQLGWVFRADTAAAILLRCLSVDRAFCSFCRVFRLERH